MTLCTAPNLSSSILNILSKDGKNIEKLMLPYLLTFIISDFNTNIMVTLATVRRKKFYFYIDFVG